MFLVLSIASVKSSNPSFLLAVGLSEIRVQSRLPFSQTRVATSSAGLKESLSLVFVEVCTMVSPLQAANGFSFSYKSDIDNATFDSSFLTVFFFFEDDLKVDLVLDLVGGTSERASTLFETEDSTLFFLEE